MQATNMAENFCSNCGKQLLHDENFCPGCGKTTVRAVPSAPTAPATPYYNPNIGQPQPQYVQQVRPEYKDPFTAALGSLLFTCVGQFYVGKWWRGLGFIALAIFFAWLTLPSGLGAIAIWIISPIDAYDQAKKHNLKYGYSEEEHEPFEALPYLRELALEHGVMFSSLGLILLVIGLVLFFLLIAGGTFVGLLIPIILVVLGIGLLYLFWTRLR
jgi:hypothetical protein